MIEEIASILDTLPPRKISTDSSSFLRIRILPSSEAVLVLPESDLVCPPSPEGVWTGPDAEGESEERDSGSRCEVETVVPDDSAPEGSP